MYAYRRSLTLINPTKQLGILTKIAKRDFGIVVKRSVRARPFYETDEEGQEETVDIKRLMYFRAHPGWIDSGMAACDYSMAFVHRYAEMGDYDVAESALGALVAINSSYVNARGNTYFSPNALMEVPTAHDGFINNTLEHLRQSLRGAVARGDERHIELIFRAFRSLVFVYSEIKYSQKHGEKTHANLAASYLANGVKSVVPHGMADVLMEGATQMGEAALLLVKRHSPSDGSMLSGELVLVGIAGLAKKEYFPVTEIAMQQFKRLLVVVLLDCDGDTRLAFEDLMSRIFAISKIYIGLPDESPFAIMGNCLGSIYSSGSPDSFVNQFGRICESLREIDGENENAKSVFHNINSFASSLPRGQREAFLIAIEKRSSFCVDIVMWIDGIAHALVVVSSYPECPEHIREELREHAYSLWCLFTWVPDEKEAITHIENSQITEKLFWAAMVGLQLGFDDYSLKIQSLLLKWTVKGGKHLTGWGILENGLCALCALVVQAAGEGLREQLRENVTQAVSGIHQDLKDRAARTIREKAMNLGGRGVIYGDIGDALNRGDREPLRELMQEIANIISPDTADEPVRNPLIFHGDG